MKFQIICIVLMFMFSGCNGGETYDPSYPVLITHQRAQEMMEQYDAVILDVRTPEEFNSGHILDAVLIPNAFIPLEIHYLVPDLDQIILVYCRTGIRSANAAQTLVEMGYRSVYDFGGILGWPGTIISEYE